MKEIQSQAAKSKSINEKEKVFCRHLNVNESQLHKALAWYQSAMQSTQQRKLNH